MNPVVAADPDSAVERAHRWLDEHPYDHAARAVLADHLDESGNPDAEPLRWLAEHGISPWLGIDDWMGTDKPRWDWYVVRPTTGGSPELDPHRIPRPVWKGVARYCRLDDPSVIELGRYDSRREAEVDFCRAYRKARAAGWDGSIGAEGEAR